ncbi:MAG TPA: type VI secretion system protein TssA [Longimicrobiales bacterium]|nr:type VI secretion system protein TssA [Longimicrobiales bacterium]
MLLREDLLDPIAGDLPAGEQLRYEPIYDEIKLARTEDDDIPQGDWTRERKTADFGRVIELAQEAIATRSKDLQLAVWLTEALLHEHGFKGFLEGLELIRGLLGEFWDGLYPELDDGDAEFRATPLEWLGNYLDLSVQSVGLNARGHTLLEYVEAQAIGYEADATDDKARAAREEAVADGKLVPEEFDAAFAATPKAFYKDLIASIDGCVETLDALDGEGNGLFGDVAPSYASLRDSIGKFRRVAATLLQRKLELDPDPVEAEPMDAGPGDATTEASQAGAAPAATRAPTNPSEAAARIAEAARFLRHLDPRNPAPYALLRGFRWAEIRATGDPPDPRLLEAPPTAVRTRLKTLLLDEDWPGLLDAGEEIMATPHGRGWLDLQRYIGTALAGLGPEYHPVRHLVMDALGRLLSDLPSLPDQTLMDDSPTANRQTREWLEAEGVLGAGDGSARPSIARATPASGGSVAAVVAQAMGHARGGDPSKAVETLLRAADRASHPREGFLLRAEAAAVMVDQGLDAVARPILDDILKVIDLHKLDNWEDGGVVARPLGLLYRVRTSSGQKADDLYERICRLDPIQAVEFQRNGPGERQASATPPPPPAPAPSQGGPPPPRPPNPLGHSAAE